jgi:DNA mismatch repair protein MutL
VRRICKRAAVKAGQVLTREEMERLVRDLERTTNPRTCPHGRPTIVQIGVEQLIRQFGRS